MKRDQLKLYFIALIPGEPVFGDVMALKSEIKERFNSKAALRSPPHITLHMPFQWREDKEDILVSSLDSLASIHQAFEIRLNGFGTFPPRVIYIRVVENQSLIKLQNAVMKNAKGDWHIYPKKGSRPFNPHITIAFRDLKKPQFFEAWKGFEKQKYSTDTAVSRISLLKHNDKTWDILHHASFK